MPYRYLDDIATADVAFEATGKTIEEMFIAAADATMNVMVDKLGSIRRSKHKTIRVESDAIDMLLFELLQELIFYKDAERLLLCVENVEIGGAEGGYVLNAAAAGEELDPERHDLGADVKAVTLHRYKVEKTAGGWTATIILDI